MNQLIEKHKLIMYINVLQALTTFHMEVTVKLIT